MIRSVVLAGAALAGLSEVASAQFLPGDLYVTAGNNIYRVDASTWSISVFADSNDGLNSPVSPAFSSSNTLIYSNYGTSEILAIDSNGITSVLYDSGDGLSGPHSIAYDSLGNILVSQPFSDQVLSCDPGGGSATVLADASDGLLRPLFMALNTDGNMLVTDDLASTVFSIDPSGAVSVFDTLQETPGAIAVRSNGDIYVVTITSSINLYRYPSGDASQRTLFATLSGPTIAAQLRFSLDERTLYMTSYDQGGLIGIDPDSASTTQLIKAGSKLHYARGITIFGTYLHPSWSNYGAGFPGTFGIPWISSQNNPLLGSNVTIDVGNSFGQPTVGLFLVGTQQASIHSGLGGDLLLIPMIIFPLSFSFGQISVGGVLPNDPRLAGTTLECQAVEADPGAAKGVSFTQGLELVLGY